VSAYIEFKGVRKTFGTKPVLKGMDLAVNKGEVMFIIGTSGVGKSVTIKHLIGLLRVDEGEIWFDGKRVDQLTERQMEPLRRRIGMVFQSSTLFDSMTLAENVALPLQQFTRLGRNEIRELAELKLSLVGLSGFGGFYPSEVSGGMVKRGGLARAMALDPEILFFDEPSSGLDPISARRLDELILELRNSLGATLVIVTHDLASIFATATNGIFLDARKKTVTAWGDPHQMLAHPPDPYVEAFLTRSVDKEST
jgi:phospholipid/cholesterol/gamma-HCH transport system ATP-binding protein